MPLAQRAGEMQCPEGGSREMFRSPAWYYHFVDRIVHGRRRPECLLVVVEKLTRGYDQGNEITQGPVQTYSIDLSLVTDH